MAGDPDPRPPRREKDAKARKRARLASDECQNPRCGRSDVPLSVHHVLYGADGRHDDPRNFLVICGDGVTGCHGKAHHADPETLRGLGEAIAARPEMIRFVEERLGQERGRDYIRRRYMLDLNPGGVVTDFKPEKKKR